MDLEDSGQAALAAFQAVQAGWEQAVAGSRNARRLLAIPALSADLAWCSRGDVLPVVVQLGRDGRLVSG
jgi:phosphosulfolactate phosphohydrolase-like enzyme